YLISPFLVYATTTPSCSTLSLHDALPICLVHRVDAQRLAHSLDHLAAAAGEHADLVVGEPVALGQGEQLRVQHLRGADLGGDLGDRKSTRLNSSHVSISYAVFCLKISTTK